MYNVSGNTSTARFSTIENHACECGLPYIRGAIWDLPRNCVVGSSPPRRVLAVLVHVCHFGGVTCGQSSGWPLCQVSAKLYASLRFQLPLSCKCDRLAWKGMLRVRDSLRDCRKFFCWVPCFYSWFYLQWPPLSLKDVPMITSHLNLVCSEQWLMYAQRYLPGFRGWWRIFLHNCVCPPSSGVMVQRVPSTCRWHLVFLSSLRGLCWWSDRFCYRSDVWRLWFGLAPVTAARPHHRLELQTLVSRMMCGRDGPGLLLWASVSQTERARCGLPTAPRALVTEVVGVFWRKVGQVNLQVVDDEVACAVSR